MGRARLAYQQEFSGTRPSLQKFANAETQTGVLEHRLAPGGSTFRSRS